MENKDSRTFEINPKIEMKKVRFMNRYGITLVGDLYLPEEYEDKQNPAVIVEGPFGAVKEQVSGLYTVRKIHFRSEPGGERFITRI